MILLNLSERKKKILSAVVDESIETAEPVGSKTLQEKYIQDVSSATIRNELMALEEMGFLYQPHTSAGRVPTAEGYKKYVEELMPIKTLTQSEAELIKSTFGESLISLDDAVFNCCNGLATVTFKGTPNSILSSVFLSCSNLKTINVPWAEGAVANAPWGATSATINYNYKS